MVIDATEIKKLDSLLKEENIRHELVEKSYAMGDHFELCIPSVNAWQRHTGMSVSINSITYGHAHGLVEFWDGKGDPVGYLNAEEALKLIKERMR